MCGVDEATLQEDMYAVGGYNYKSYQERTPGRVDE